MTATIISDVDQSTVLSIPASNLSLFISFHQDGIARVMIDEIDGIENRFKISDEPDFAVMEDQLN